MKNLTTCPVADLMVHMVKGRQYSAYTSRSHMHIDVGASITEMESETDSRPRHRQFLITGDELDSVIHLMSIGLVVAWHTACVLYMYIAQDYYSFIYPRDYVSQENA